MSSEPIAPGDPKIAFADLALYRKAATRMESEYLSPLQRSSNATALSHSQSSRLRAIGFRSGGLDSQSSRYGEKFTDMADGFERVASLDDYYWNQFRARIPASARLSEDAASFVTDLAIMKVRFDEFLLGTPDLNNAVGQQIEELLAKLGYTPPAEDDERPKKKTVKVTLPDVIRPILDGDISLTPLVEPVK